jgi:hypothetical protein
MVHPVPEEFFAEINRERRCPLWRHPSLRPIDPPSKGDLPGIQAPTMPLASADGILMDQIEEGEVGGLMDNDNEGEETGGEEEADVERIDTELAEEEDRDRQQQQKEMKTYAKQLHELADMIAYNAPYADQRMLDFITRKATSAIELQEKIKSKENRSNSSSAPHLPMFSPEFSDVIFIRTRPLARIHENLSKYE